jgi:2-haloacid dehalogenase
VPRYRAIGFDLLTALLDTWSLWTRATGDRDRALAWHRASQDLLRGRPYRPYEDIVREAAEASGVARAQAEDVLERWAEIEPWPDTRPTIERLGALPRFVVTNCSERLGMLAARRADGFDLVMTAERAGAYKPDPRPYRAALAGMRLEASDVLFVAGSAHDLDGARRVGMDVYWANRGGAPAPAEGRALREEPDLRGLVELVA